MPMSEAQKKARDKYNAKAYEALTSRLPRGKKAILQVHITKHNESLNGFINRAIDEAIARDNEQIKLNEADNNKTFTCLQEIKKPPEN